MHKLMRFRLRLTTIGALAGMTLAFLWTGLVAELVWVAIGAALGWGVALALALVTRNHLGVPEDVERVIDLTEGCTRDELYDEAQRLGIEGRSTMDKHELAEAIVSCR